MSGFTRKVESGFSRKDGQVVSGFSRTCADQQRDEEETDRGHCGVEDRRVCGRAPAGRAEARGGVRASEGGGTGVDSNGRSAMASVAFLGTGLLGGAMVEGMLRRGDAVTVWNRTEAKARALEAFGAKVAATPGDAVAGADRVHMTLPDDEVVEQIVAAFTPRLRRGRDRHRSHDGVAARHQGARGAAERRRREVSCTRRCSCRRRWRATPSASSSCPGRRRSTTRVLDTLEAMTGEVWYLGEQGDLAAAYKIFGNSMLFVIAAGVTDVFAMAKGLGISAADALTVFSKFQPGGLIKARGDKMARGDFSASFELDDGAEGHAADARGRPPVSR